VNMGVHMLMESIETHFLPRSWSFCLTGFFVPVVTVLALDKGMGGEFPWLGNLANCCP
jgi:hypothetical protein